MLLKISLAPIFLSCAFMIVALFGQSCFCNRFFWRSWIVSCQGIRPWNSGQIFLEYSWPLWNAITTLLIWFQNHCLDSGNKNV